MARPTTSHAHAPSLASKNSGADPSVDPVTVMSKIILCREYIHAPLPSMAADQTLGVVAPGHPLLESLQVVESPQSFSFVLVKFTTL